MVRPSQRPRRHAAHALAAVAALFGGLALGFAGCVDLFHSTDFGGSCPPDGGCKGVWPADGAHAEDAWREGGPARRTDATMGHDGGLADARATHDASPDVRAASHDARPDVGVDAGTNFCDWTGATPADNAMHACLWLGACAGAYGLNEFGTCYPNALLAYDCALNPNQRVRGPLHAFWDALWQATTCEDVLRAIFPGGPPSCSSALAGCASDLADGGYPGVAVVCADGGFAAAINCDMAGYTCVGQGACGLADPAPCATAGAGGSSCSGNIFHGCRTVEDAIDAALPTSVIDIGKDCSHFGAGSCAWGSGGALGGCLPNDASVPCTTSSYASCADGGASVTGCATGVLETLNCARFGAGNTCSIVSGGWFAPSNDLVRGCYDPFGNGESIAADSCNGANAFSDYAGPCGNVLASCADAGLGTCGLTPASTAGGPRPYCGKPAGL